MKKAMNTKLQAQLLLACVPVGFAFAQFLEPSSLEQTTHIVESYLLPLFFLGVGIELRQEFSVGYFKVRRLIIAPAIAALLGVALPALTFLVVAGPLGGAWSIPTATDITLGLAVLGLAGAGYSAKLRPRFLAFATIDDLLGLLILLIVFSGEVNLLHACIAVASLIAFYLLGRSQRTMAIASMACVVLGLAFGANSGLQNSIIAVAFGLVVNKPHVWRFLAPLNGWFILPAFAFVASANAGQVISGAISITVLLAICLRPAAKLAGIAIGGSIASWLVARRADTVSWIGLGVLGGIGFTVSFLLASVALHNQSADYSAAIIGTLIATGISAIAFLIFASFQGRRGPRDEKSL
ncbi:MAG: hypothetical protein RL488_1060 [Actinomycetota bacterium]|jgi:NhaA family Na+:H+ antiporter